jgi:hypothetical protein
MRNDRGPNRRRTGRGGTSKLGTARRLIAVAAVAPLALLSLRSTTGAVPSTPGVQPVPPIRAAFYYPWFPEAWSQNGVRPFTNYRPSLGLYDSSNPTVVRRHIAAMQYGRIDAGIASWWGPGSKTDGRIRTLLRSAKGTGFKWALYYEPEGYGDPTVGKIQSDLSYIRSRYAIHPSFLRIGGRFVVFVYADATDDCGMADRWRAATDAGAYVVLKVFSGFGDCPQQPSSWHQYAPASAVHSQAPYSYSISPGFWKKGEEPRLERSLSRWKRNIRSMVASKVTFELVTTFNEWGEGTSVEKASQWPSPAPHGPFLQALNDNGIRSRH